MEQYGCFKFDRFRKRSGRRSSASPEILAFVSHCLATFQLILDCFMSKFKLKYQDLENIKSDAVNTVVFHLHQIKRRTSFLEHPVDLFHTENDNYFEIANHRVKMNYLCQNERYV